MQYDFLPLAILIGTISLGIIGVLMSAGGFLPDISETAKRRIPYVLFGIVLVSLAATIIGTFSGG